MLDLFIAVFTRMQSENCGLDMPTRAIFKKIVRIRGLILPNFMTYHRAVIGQ